MQTKQITAKYVNPAKSPRGPGSVKDEQGIYWKVWPDLLSRFQVGGTYTVGYKTEQHNGKDQFTVTQIQDVTGQQLSQPSVPSTNGHGDHSRDEQIYVCGIVNNAIAAGKVDPFSTDELVSITQAATDAFRAWRANT